jgi:hypothetical protein
LPVASSTAAAPPSAPGDVEYALRVSEEAVNLTPGLDDSPVAAWAGVVHGCALLESGHVERARDVFERSCGGTELTRIPGAWRAIRLVFP